MVVNCLILAFIGFSKNGSSDNNLALVNFLILDFTVFPSNGSCFKPLLYCWQIKSLKIINILTSNHFSFLVFSLSSKYKTTTINSK